MRTPNPDTDYKVKADKNSDLMTITEKLSITTLPASYWYVRYDRLPEEEANMAIGYEWRGRRGKDSVSIGGFAIEAFIFCIT